MEGGILIGKGARGPKQERISMERRWAKQQGRHPQAFQERPSGKGVIFSCVTRHPHGSRADEILSPMPEQSLREGAYGVRLK
jgi:hypothetical protein